MAYDGSTGPNGIHLLYDLLTEAWKASVRTWGIGATSTQGECLENTTPAATGVQQYSPRREVAGKGWKTDATAASVDCRVGEEVRPVQGAAAPSFVYALMQKIGSASWGDLFTLTSDKILSGLARINTVVAASASGAIAALLGPSATEGVKTVVQIETLSPAAVETAMATVIPKGSVVKAVLAICTAALTGGGTTATWSVGTAGDPDKYGTAGHPTAADSLAKNSKSNWMVGATVEQLAADETIKLTGAATGGAADGNTALTVGSVKIMVTYETFAAFANV